MTTTTFFLGSRSRNGARKRGWIQVALPFLWWAGPGVWARAHWLRDPATGAIED